MGSLAEHTTQMQYIQLALVLFVTTAAVVLGLTGMGRKTVNSRLDEMNSVATNIQYQFFEEWDGATCTGLEVKQCIERASNRDCAVLIQTKPFLDMQTGWTGVGSEGNVLGTDAATDIGEPFKTASNEIPPICQIDVKDGKIYHGMGVKADGSEDTTRPSFPVDRTLKGSVSNSCLVNYGTILRHSVKDFSAAGFTSTLTVSGNSASLAIEDIDTATVDKPITIGYSNGKFMARQGLALTDENSYLRYEDTKYLTDKDSVLYVQDDTLFQSYLLHGINNTPIGIVFIQMKNE